MSARNGPVVRNRVALGGHDVPEADVRRRFVGSHTNLPAAIARADVALLCGNTDVDEPYREVGIFRKWTWWSTETVPDWTAAAIAHTMSSHSG